MTPDIKVTFTEPFAFEKNFTHVGDATIFHSFVGGSKDDDAIWEVMPEGTDMMYSFQNGKGLPKDGSSAQADRTTHEKL